MKKWLASLTNQIMIAMVAGMVAGLAIGPAIGQLKFLGDIFLRLIQMSVVVLIMGAVIEAVGSLDPSKLQKMGAKVFSQFMISTLFAAGIGVALGNIIKPGSGLGKINLGQSAVKPADVKLQDMLVNFFPTNIIKSMAEAQMIQVIVFALLFGLALSIIGKQKGSNPLLDTIKQFNVAILGLVKMIMRMAPIGIFALLSWVTGTIGIKVIIPLAKFLGAMAIGSIIVMSVSIFVTAVYVKVNPFKLAGKLMNMTIVAFTTTSSAITLPTKMEDQEKKLGVSHEVSNLVGPLAMALNSNGLSLYLALAVITISQFFNVNMTITQQVQAVVLATLACLGTVVVPGGGLVALATVLPAMGLPLEGVALLAGIDWFSGMFRTVLNVDVDALIALTTAKSEGEFDRDIFDGKKVINERVSVKA